jgi:SAM-dependent methyltransferase
MKQQDFQNFFSSKLGIFTKERISEKLISFIPNFEKQKILVIGNGAIYLKNNKNVKQIKKLTEETEIADDYYDIIIVAHFLEFQNKDNFIIRKIWQSLKDNGKVITLTTNRHSLWFYLGNHIFRTPKAYSHYQITKLLDSNLLITDRVESVLFFPPTSKLKIKSKWMKKIDKFISFIACKNGGIIISSAIKRVYASAIHGKKAKTSAQYIAID